MTTRAAQPGLVSQATAGILYIPLSGTGAVFLPITAKPAQGSGSGVITVAFTRGFVAPVILLIATLLLCHSLRPGSGCAIVLAALFRFEKLARVAR